MTAIIPCAFVHKIQIFFFHNLLHAFTVLKKFQHIIKPKSH